MSDNVLIFGGSEHRRRLIPERLVKARKAIRLTQTEVAEKVGLTRQAISAFETGTKNPDGATMFALTDVLRQPISYFTAAVPPPFGPFSARTFRAFGPMTRRRNDQCAVLSEWLVSVASFYSTGLNFPAPSIPAAPPPQNGNYYDEEEIEEATVATRRAWGLGDGPIGNLIKLVESRGVFVAHLPIEDDTVNAFSFWSGSVPFIIMGSDNTSAVRRRFDIAHELGHLVLHQGIGEEELEDKDTLNQIEDEANRFAGAFLLPAKSYPNEIFTARLDAFERLKERWKVAISAQVYRCSDLGIFSEHQILNLRKQISARKWRKREPLDDVIPLETPSLINKGACLLLESKKTSPEDIKSEINLSVEVIEKLSGLRQGALRPREPENPPISLK